MSTIVHKWQMSIALVALALASADAKVEDWLPGAATPQEEWRQLPLDAIRLGGVMGHRIDLTVTNNLLKVDPDRTFLKYFREKGSAEYKLIGYAALGKFIEANVLLAKHTGNRDLLARKQYLVAETLKTQEPDGYIGAYAEGRLDKAWDAHEIAYIITALMADWEEFGNKAALDGARRLADYVLANWRNLPDDWGQTWCNVPMYAIGQCQAMLRVYQATGDKRYLDFCLNERCLADFDTPVFVGRDNMVWGHTYTYFNQCYAQHILYRLQGRRDGRLLMQTARGLDALFDRNGALVTGICGIAECWDLSQDGDGAVGEVCATRYQLICCDSLMRLGIGDAGRLGDIIERTVYGGLFGAQSPDGRRHRYYTPLLGEREYFIGAIDGHLVNGDIYCCPNNYRRMMGRLPQFVYHVKSNALRVNLYTPSVATCDIGGNKVKVVQDTDYPTSGKIRITLDPAREAAFSVFVRIPTWCRSPTVKMCGTPIRQVYSGGRYLRLTKTWKKGDAIDLDFPMEIRTVRGRARQSGRFCVMRGPLVYAFNPKAQLADPLVQLDGTKNLHKDAVALFGRHPFDIQHTMVVDPATLRLSKTSDSSSRPDGTAIEALAGVVHHAVGSHQGARAWIRLTEFADPGASVTYFRAPDLERQVTEDDELFK